MRRVSLLLSTALLAAGATTVAEAQSWRADRAAEPPMIGFGASVAIAGQDVLVGRPGLVVGFPMPPAQTGAIHVFRHRSGEWHEAGAVSARDTVLGDGFGVAMSVDGSWMAVGAPRAGDGRGAVYLFERARNGQWSQRAKLTLAGGDTVDRFGSAVALSGTTLIVGAPGREGGRGEAVVFRKGQTDWTQVARLTAPQRAEGDRFGTSISLGGTRALVGAPGPVGGNPAQLKLGGAHVFTRNSAGAWAHEAALAVASDSAARSSGAAVLLAGEEALVSSPTAGQMAGAVFRFRRDGNAWREVGRLTPREGDGYGFFGMTLAHGGGDLFVGAPMAGQSAGAAYVFRADGGEWKEVQRLTIESTGLGSSFGSSIAVNGSLATIGASGADFFEGRAFLYAKDAGGKWTQAASVVDNTPSALMASTGSEVRCAEGKARMFDCRGVDLVSYMPLSALGGKRGIMLNDMWGWSDSQTGREFAIVGRLDGTAFIEVTDPARPVYLGELPLHEGARPNLWRDIKVYRNHAFIVADGAGPHGVQVFDLTQLRNVRNPPQTFEETAHYDRIHSAHNISIDEESGFAYTIGNSMGGETCGGGPHMIDIRDPRKPTFAGCAADPATGFAKTGYTHDNQCVVYRGPDEQYRGRQICFNSSENALGIADVTDKRNPKRISSASYPNVAYAHQGWLTEDHKYFFLNDEGDELTGTVPRTRTLVFDVTDLDDPVVAREFLGATPATDHNLYVKGDYMYQSNYVAGLRVIDVRDPVNPVEVGWFDTVPFGEDIPGFAGTWSNYPYFKSGVVGVTSMREGFFLLRYRPPTVVP